MDYDENDFQNQNFELTREDTGKFPSILRPFSLPKFDIDEPLHVPVRFDSLPEPDCLFTITGLCSGSNWINDFSPQNSTTKSKNVWSEATSSESVEMLLKSVREEKPIMDSGVPRETLNGTDYSHMMDMDPSGSILDHSDDRQMRSSAEECITEEKHIENSLDSTKLPESSEGLLEAITYPIRNLNKEMQNKEISPLAERYGIDAQFENVSYPRIGTPLVGSGEENKELSGQILNMGEKEKAQLETEQLVQEDCGNTKDLTSSIDERKQKDMAAANDEQGVIGKETFSKERDLTSITDNVVSDGTVHDSLKSQSNEQVTTRDGSVVGDAMKEQSGSDHTAEVETPPSMPAQDSMRPSEHSSGKGKEASTDLSDSVMVPEAAIIGSVSKETLPPQADGDKILTPPPPSMEGKSSPMVSETDLDIGIGKANAISADEAQGSNPCTEDVAKDDTITAGTGTDNNQSSTELTCGSPTIISGRLDETKEDGVSDDLAQDANKAKHGLECSNRDTTASEDDKSFSFNVVANIPERETVPNWKPFPSMKSPDIATPSKGSSKGGTLPGNTTKNKYEATNDVKTPKTEEKTPDPSPKKKRERKKTQSVPSPIKMEPTKKRPPGSSGRARVKTPSSASGLPDLSASASSTQLAHQPFTDLQHVQLRAQIFAYGSLIQGVPPSETYMVSAFGDSGAVRKKWEAAWRTAMERYQNQKSPLSASSPETPGSSQPVHRSTENASKESAAKRKSSAPGKKASIKSEVPTTLTVPSASPILPASLPRGAHLDFTQNVSPSPMFNPYQPLQVKHQPSGTGTTWLSPSHPNPWLLTTQSSVFKTTPVSPVPTAATISTTAEASKITPRRKTPSTSVPLPPPLPVVFPPTNFPAIASAANTTASIAPVSAPSNVIATVSPPASIGATDTQKITVVSPLPTVSPTTTPKTRKRKKAPGNPATEPEKLQVSSPMALIPTSSSPSTQPKIIFTGQLASVTSLVTPTSPIPSYPVVSANISVGPSEHNKTVSEDTSSRIEQSKLHAEDAAAHAAAAVRYSQSVWSQLSAQRNSGLTSDVEQKLASAAVAAAAAAAVAKAAAAAAKVASEAALQAKMMAEESVRPPLMSEKTGPLGSVQASFISMARETAKQRVEATSAAAKRAENLDAVIRAAEVAAEAVSQAGVVVAMGDPLPLGIKDLLEAGPEGYWKAHFSKTEIEKQLPATTSHLQLEVGEARPENQEKVKEQSLSTQKVPRNTEAGKTTDVPVASEKDITVNELPSAKEKEIGFQKGSQIEVFADEASHRGVWFHATVLDVEENRIHVCYTDRFADEELGQVKEWIVLRNEGDKPPRVRAAHPATGPKPEGTRKRRREAVGTSSWDVGDHVDAWIRDGWREGIVTEKSDADGTKYTVQFLVAGGSSVVESWHLRPSLIWQDGQWSLWSRSLAKKTHPKEGESPYEKRQRFGQLESDPNQATTAANADSGPVPQKKSEDSRPLNLPADDKVLTMGKFTMGDPNSKRVRAGSQKEGSRVVFGVPRPGKKKKYMDVSKHYDGGKPDKVAATATEANSNPSVKLANYLMPQNRAPKSKAEPKAKEAADSKQRAGVKSGKSHALNSSETSLDSLSEQRVPPRKKLGMSHEHDVGGKGKAISSAAGNADSSLADSSEPRRSNRRIQPTSRLLEGLQSSLMIAKVPTDKGTRTTLKGGVPSKDRVNG